MVLVVLGLLVGLVVSRGPQRSITLDLRAATQTVATSLRAARVEAIARNQDQVFVLNVAQHSFRVNAGPVKQLPREIVLSMATIAGATSGQQAAALRFLPDGSSTGGRIALSEGQRHMLVLVDWLTGRVSIDAR